MESPPAFKPNPKRSEVRIAILDEVESKLKKGIPAGEAYFHPPASPHQIRRWRRLVKNHPRSEWGALLETRYYRGGSRPIAPVSPAALDFFIRTYLIPGGPSLQDAYLILRSHPAAAHWEIPSLATLARRVSGKYSSEEIARARTLRKNFPPAESRLQWETYDRAPTTMKATASRRIKRLLAVETIEARGLGRIAAIARVARETGDSPATIRRWFGLVRGHPFENWPPLLIPRYAGRKTRSLVSPPLQTLIEDLLKANPEAPSTAILAALKERWKAENGPLPGPATINRYIVKNHGPRPLIRRRRGPVSAARALDFGS